MWGTIGSMPTNIIIIGEFVLRIRRKAFLNLIFSLPGRRHCQLRLVEPSYKSINSGDCYLLITPQRSFVWVGEYANVIEKAKVCLFILVALVDEAMMWKCADSKKFQLGMQYVRFQDCTFCIELRFLAGPYAHSGG